MAKDILILGGGPSGLSTALHLAQLAPELIPRILVLEKEHYPRPKLCAGGLVADAEIILQRLGLDVSEIPHVDASAAHFNFAGKGMSLSLGRGHFDYAQCRRARNNVETGKEQSASIRVDPRPMGNHILRVVRRDEFDHWLAQKTRERGIEIREGITVKCVQAREEDVIVETDSGVFTAQVAVGADGSNGVTRRCMLPDAPVHTARVLEVLAPEQDVIASSGAVSATMKQSPTDEEIASDDLSTLLRSAQDAPRNDIHDGGHAYFDFFPVPDGIAGYTWDFPTQVKGQPMRCWGIYDTNLLADMQRPALKEPLAEEMKRHGFDLVQVKLKGHPIRWFSPHQPMSAPRVLLVGDAVGADGIFGEGISMALGYGLLAAQEIRQAFEQNDFSFKGYRRRVLRSALGQSLTARWLITEMLYRLHWAWFQKFFWRHFKPVIIAAAWIFVLNWGKRMDARRSAS